MEIEKETPQVPPPMPAIPPSTAVTPGSTRPPSSPYQAQQNQPLGPISYDVEYGRTGLRRWGGIVREEFLPELQGYRGRRVIREMVSNDPIIGAILYATEQLARQVSWRVDPPASPSQQDLAATEFLRGALFDDMSSTWPDQLSERLTMLPWGFEYAELVYKRRNGQGETPGESSRFNDGLIGWRKWPTRSQESLFQWRFDDSGGVQAMVQQDPSTAQFYTIPIEKSLLFRTSIRKGNPEGVSLFRTAYRPWMFKKRLEEIEGIGVERDLAGYPTVVVDREGPDIWNTANPDAAAQRQAIEAFVRNVRRDSDEGAVLPWWCDFKLLSTGSRRLFDTNEIIKRYEQRIAMTTLADFLFLGHEMRGSFALASSKTTLFALALGCYLDSITEVINRHAIPRLWALNGWSSDRAPRLAHGDIQAPNLMELGEYIKNLAGAGFPVFPDPNLERKLRASIMAATGTGGGEELTVSKKRPATARDAYRKGWGRLARARWDDRADQGEEDRRLFVETVRKLRGVVARFGSEG